MTTLKETQNNPEKLGQFIKEHEKDAQGNDDRLFSAISAMSEEIVKEDQEALSQDDCDG